MPAPPTSRTLSSPPPRQRRRLVVDALARYTVGLGGVFVIAAVALIFFYLLYIVIPLFMPADARPLANYPLPGGSDARTAHLVMDELREVGLRHTGDGRVFFFRPADGSLLGDSRALLPPGARATAFSAGDSATGITAYGLNDGRAVVIRSEFKVTYPNDVRVVTPHLSFPLGEAPIVVDHQQQPLTRLAVQQGEESVTLVATTGDGRLILTHITQEFSFLDDEVTLEVDHAELPAPDQAVDFLLLDKEQRTVYAAGRDGWMSVYDIRDPQSPALIQRLRVVGEDLQVSALTFLTGDISLLIADSTGAINQWFPVRDETNTMRLTRIRTFDTGQGAIHSVGVEPRRKGFMAADDQGRVGIYHATAHRLLEMASVSAAPIRLVSVAPRADAFLAEDDSGHLHYWTVHNEHPEVSWSALWGKVWYESYAGPEYVWQSSSASNDFEPKFSLTPLAFGTLKAAFYAMLFAIPLAIMGAIYTAYFMAPRMRRLVKPGIEIMEALPTVILGFLAGLWLAPVVEKNMPGVFALLLFVPLGALLFAYLWRLLPSHLTQRVPEGWDAALLIPAILLSSALALWLGPYMEHAWFGGNMPEWLSHTMGISFDQRNALIVGIAMGFAVIPTIFSMTEDAIFNVPKHLRNGSLALGATQWQTLTRVVILTASPGIFAAVMIGLGRAVGETMIVLMATGNTPVLDFSLFQGMRTLSANIAVEMPESEVGSTHYRILFLAALVLFAFTFIVNTAGELVRQRLRNKYGNL